MNKTATNLIIGVLVVAMIISIPAGSIPAGVFLAYWYNDPFWLIMSVVGLIFGLAG